MSSKLEAKIKKNQKHNKIKLGYRHQGTNKISTVSSETTYVVEYED